jgi:uncharacterized protein YdhG (YjbR/CyaY superfamily)
MNATKTSAKSNKPSERFSADERSAMKERAKELKASNNAAADLADVLAKIAEMPESDRVMASRLHELITAAAPDLAPKTWYGMPAYARNGKLICFFKAADKFKTRYATFGFEENAKIDDGSMWATSWALTKLTPADEAKIVALVKKA